MSAQRIGFYCWGGPGTIRMINLKYFSPPLDVPNIMASYDYEYLSRIKEIFGVTDVWATYSWGFSEKTEQEDYEFLLSRIKNFRKLGLKLHAYIQGANLVYEDYKNKQWFCEDERGRPITYYRGRRVTCLNNPEFREYVFEKLTKMGQYDFDGIYMDNIQMGQLGIPTTAPVVFAGCNCIFCRKLFHDQSHEQIPTNFEDNLNLTQKYIDFRASTTTGFLEDAANIVHKNKMEFGSNSFDVDLDTHSVLGTDLSAIAKIQDYMLFENHSLPTADGVRNNAAADAFARKIHKPVFVVSYKEGIGKEDNFSQEDLNNIYSEDKQFSFFACLKGSEYTTNGVWHNLYIEKYSKPRRDIRLMHHQNKHLNKNIVRAVFRSRLLRLMVKRFYNPVLTLYMENRFLRNLFEGLYYVAIR